jgi:type IV pilus assembly protein PilO
MTKKKISLEALKPFFDKIEKLSKTQRILIYVGTFLLLIGGFVYFSYLPKYQSISELEEEYSNLEMAIIKAKKNATRLPKLKKEMEKSRIKFSVVRKALPDKQEIPSLLSSVSRSGRDVGLEFLLFQPKPELNKDFYAELPVSIQVKGGYHSVGLFFDKVAHLPRIVTIDNVKISPDKGGKKGEGTILNTSCTAVTYKFVEEAPIDGTKKQ